MFNYLDAYVFFIDNAPATAFAAGNVDDADCKYLGVVQSEAGYKLGKSEVVKASTGNDTTLSYKMEIKAELLEKLTNDQKAEIDGITGSLLFLPIDGVTIPDGAVPLTLNLNSAGVVLPASPTGVMTYPTKLAIEEDVKYGTGKVSPIVVSGEKTAESKESLVKTVTINDTV